MSEESPRGILRNKKEEKQKELDEKFDRKKVYENTLLNAKLNGDFKSRGDEIRARIAEEKKRKQDDKPKSINMDVLKWDEANLIESEMNKSATMKIDEPKTPYQGSVDPNSEYYRSDEDDDFVLGAAEEPLEEPLEEPQDDENGEIHHEPRQPQSPEQEQNPEQEKHKKFEELRKKHYHMKGLPLKKPVDASDEEE